MVEAAPAPAETPFVMDDGMWRALDLLGVEMGSSTESEQASLGLLGSAAELGSIGLAAGFLTWFLRGGTLLTSLLSTLPLWTQFDPLPVLAGGPGRVSLEPKPQEGERDRAERHAGRILDAPSGAISIAAPNGPRRSLELPAASPGSAQGVGLRS